MRSMILQAPTQHLQHRTLPQGLEMLLEIAMLLGVPATVDLGFAGWPSKPWLIGRLVPLNLRIYDDEASWCKSIDELVYWVITPNAYHTSTASRPSEKLLGFSFADCLRRPFTFHVFSHKTQHSLKIFKGTKGRRNMKKPLSQAMNLTYPIVTLRSKLGRWEGKCILYTV